MKRGLSIVELIRQDVLDLDPESPRPPCPIPPRLLILACSATKATGEGLAARDRYQGPLWQTLRAADPDGSKAFTCFLSARFGLGDARSALPHYDRVLTDADADRMAKNTWGCYPELPQSDRMTMAAKLRVANRDGLPRSPSGVLTRLVRKLGQLFRAVAICGGHRYVRVASSWLPDFRPHGPARGRRSGHHHQRPDRRDAREAAGLDRALTRTGKEHRHGSAIRAGQDGQPRRIRAGTGIPRPMPKARTSAAASAFLSGGAPPPGTRKPLTAC